MKKEYPKLDLSGYSIRPVGHREAKLFVETWHYSARMPTGKNVSYGVEKGGVLYAVIVYGIGVNPYQAAFLGVADCVEIKRMCRVEPKGEYPLSKLISLSTKLLCGVMQFQAIVAFADPTHGHEGGVYKASGYLNKGISNAEYHLTDADGNVRHRRYAYRHARRNGITVAESREQLGLSRIKTLPKHRWVRYVRGNGGKKPVTAESLC